MADWDVHEKAVAFVAQRKNRTALLATAVILQDEAELATVRIRNLSAGGMGASGRTDLQPGDAVTARLKGIGDVPGQIAWKRGSRFGVQFERQIDPTELERGDLAAAPLSDSVIVPRTFEPVSDTRRPGLR